MEGVELEMDRDRKASILVHVDAVFQVLQSQ